MKKTTTMAAMAVLALAASAAQASITACGDPTNLVANGSFECGSVPAAGTWVINPGPTGWNVGDPGQQGVELRNDIAGTAQQGSIYVELDANRNVSISQDLKTVAGQAYSVSFWWSDRAGTSNAATDGLSFSVGGVGGQIAGGTNGSSDNDWHQFVRSFIATGDTTTLTFTGTGTSDSYGTSLDNIRVSAVPEPATLALMASGLALLGLARRRRRD